MLPPEQAYGMARGLNFRRTVALVTVTADDGSMGYGEALGPLAPIGEYLSLLRPFFLGRSIFDFELIAAQIYNRLYHFGVQGHHTACLSAISIALHDAIGKSLGSSGPRSARRPFERARPLLRYDRLPDQGSDQRFRIPAWPSR